MKINISYCSQLNLKTLQGNVFSLPETTVVVSLMEKSDCLGAVRREQCKHL
jgi:hypothetical protein